MKLEKYDWVTQKPVSQKRLLRKEGKDGYTQVEHKEDSRYNRNKDPEITFEPFQKNDIKTVRKVCALNREMLTG